MLLGGAAAAVLATALPAMASPISGHDATSTGSTSTILNPGDIVTGVRATGNGTNVRFSPTADPTLALPLAGGHGYWLIGVLTQTVTCTSVAGTRTDTFPDGASIATTRPAVVHHATDTYITTYTAIDPIRFDGGTVALDGFFGWPLTAIAS